MEQRPSACPPVLLQHLPEGVPVAPLLPPLVLLFPLPLLPLLILKHTDVLLEHLKSRQPIKRLRVAGGRGGQAQAAVRSKLPSEKVPQLAITYTEPASQPLARDHSQTCFISQSVALNNWEPRLLNDSDHGYLHDPTSNRHTPTTTRTDHNHRCHCPPRTPPHPAAAPAPSSSCCWP